MLEQELADTPNAPHLGCKLFLHLLLLPRSLLSLVLGMSRSVRPWEGVGAKEPSSSRHRRMLRGLVNAMVEGGLGPSAPVKQDTAC